MTENILDGVIDIHLHPGPDVVPRKLTCIEAARRAEAAGMRAILIKSHVTITAGIAAVIQTFVPGLSVFGGIALNGPVGGLNPEAVEAALRLGARQVWMPTLWSVAHQRHHQGRLKGISLLTGRGTLKKAVFEILEIMAGSGAILASGHIGLREMTVLVREARARGLRKILITHPENVALNIPGEIQKKLARQGVFFDRCLPRKGSCAIGMEAMAARIREVGVSSTVLSTDLGQPDGPCPVEGMENYLREMIRFGFTAPEIDRMARLNPAALLDLD